jgi:tetratricopeptide (TPR) repeat protein
VYSKALGLAGGGPLTGRVSDTDLGSLHDNLGYAFLQTGQVGEAVRELELAQGLKPAAPNANRFLPVLRQQTAKLDASIARLESALAARPDDLAVLHALAVQNAMKGRYDDALRYLEKELAIKPGNPETYYNMACIYAKKRDVEKALDSLEQAVRNGFSDWALLGSDHDLDGIRSAPAFRKLTAGH